MTRNAGRRELLRARPARIAVRTIASAFWLVLVASCSGRGAEKAPENEARASDEAPEAEGEAAHARVAASVEAVTAETFVEAIDASGTVVPRVGRFAALAAPAPTRITGVHVAPGARVHRGDRLVSFEATAFDAAVSSADAALSAAVRAEERARRLVEAGVAPRKDAELAASEVAAARAASVNAHRASGLAVLRSPIDGVVTSLNAVLGANADVGQTLVEIVDTRALDVQLVLSPQSANGVRAGQSVTLRDGALADALVVATGKVSAVTAALDSASRGVVVRVSIDNQQRTVRIGETLYARIDAQSHAGALLIAGDALVPAGDGFQVFVVDSAGVAHARPVHVGARAGNRVWIREGLAAGEKVVTAGAFGVSEGAEIVTKQKPGP